MAETKVKNSQLENHGSGMVSIANNSTATVITVQDQWTPIQNLKHSTHTDNFTYTDGNLSSISGVSDAGGGDITINTSTNHEASIGDPIVVTGTALYNGLYIVTAVPGLTQVNVTAAYGGDSLVGSVILPDRLEALSADEYTLQYSVSATASVNNDILAFTLGVNDTTYTELIRPRKFSSSDQGVIAATWFEDISVGDIIYFAAANTSGTGNLTIQYGTWGVMGPRS